MMLPPLRDVIKSSELWAKRSLGQNFLLDLNITRKIAKAAGSLKGATVIEVGPGPGGLTRALLETEAHSVIALEKDPRALIALASLKKVYQERLILKEADALEVPLYTLGDPPRYVIANLPYNIATPLLMQWLDHASFFHKFILMFQKEVADRIIALPHSKNYGRLSVKVQWLCKVKLILTLPPEAFWPSPKVSSSVVEITPYPEPLFQADSKDLEFILKCAFTKRRKMIRSSLADLNVPLDILFKETEINPTQRAENLSVEDYCKLTRVYSKLKKE
ncbi:MAG: 16S rRNA (adenine(1518)-N(6)/adenine(1519)-N(6))-dimethyltransferase RsmA [Proteobacteria bacterium]|nr:16S rRNA (adenine(1518)-N(6)/adenine(1519)-N(6))-dimethyltransferase RsmA [Pseudomonadota bacterium]